MMGLHGDVFPSLDSNSSSLMLMGIFFIHLAVQVHSLSYTPLSPGWALAVNLVLWYHCWEIHQSEDNSLHTLNQPSLRLEPTTYQRP